MQRLRDKVLSAHTNGDVEALSLALCLVWKLSLSTPNNHNAGSESHPAAGVAPNHEIKSDMPF